MFCNQTDSLKRMCANKLNLNVSSILATPSDLELYNLMSAQVIT